MCLSPGLCVPESWSPGVCVSESWSLCAPAGGEQHVPGGPHGEQLGPLHHLAHGGAGPGGHPRARGRAAGLREPPQLQLLCEFTLNAVVSGVLPRGSPDMHMGSREKADMC